MRKTSLFQSTACEKRWRRRFSREALECVRVRASLLRDHAYEIALDFAYEIALSSNTTTLLT